MGAIAPNASYHHTELGIKGDELAKEKLARPLIGIRQTGFEDGNEISTETDEGHTGVSNLDMGSYRTNAESAPTWEDGARYGQGFEDYIYLLLPNVVTSPYENEDEETVDGIYKHVFSMPPNVDKDLPYATIYHGFSKTETDARIFNNALENEFEFTMAADEKPTCKPTFISDYNYVNCIEPVSTLLADHLLRTVMAHDTSVYIGAVGATAEEMFENPIDCFTEASWNVNHNAETQACHGDNFGENTKIMGARELTGSITMPWVDRTKYFETEYECYEKYGHIVSEKITQKQIWYHCKGGDIKINTGTAQEPVWENSGVPFECLFKFPVVEATNVTSTKSGNEAKDLTLEWKGIEQPTQSYMTAEIITDLAALHIDDVGATRQSYYPNTTKYPEFAATAGQ